MKKILQLNLALAFILIFCTFVNSKSNTLISMDIKQPLQMEISLEDSRFLIGEPIFLRIIFKNTSPESIRILDPGPILNADIWKVMKVTIEGPKPPMKLTYPRNHEDIERLPGKEPGTILKPGDEIIKRDDLVKCRIYVAGHYKVTVEYNVPQFRQALIPPMFTGKLISSLDFDVIEPIGEDAAFLEAFREQLINNNTPPERRCYYQIYFGTDYNNELYRRYPNSHYAGWIWAKAIFNPTGMDPSKVINGIKLRSWITNNYIPDLNKPYGKKELTSGMPREQKIMLRNNWEIGKIDEILALHSDEPYAEYLQIERGLDMLALKKESEGLAYLKEVIKKATEEAGAAKVPLSREIQWAQQFVEIWTQQSKPK